MGKREKRNQMYVTFILHFPSHLFYIYFTFYSFGAKSLFGWGSQHYKA